MATFLTHGVVALVAGRASYRRAMPLRFWLLAPLCSMLPDVDVVLFHFGVQYGDLWGHRGMTHGLLFAALLALIVVTLAFRREAPVLCPRWWGLVGFFFLLTASHGVIDAFTNGGLGIAFLSPFDPTRYFFPWTPIQVSPIGVSALFSRWGAEVIVSEMIWVWTPLLVLGVAVWMVRRSHRRPSDPGERRFVGRQHDNQRNRS